MTLAAYPRLAIARLTIETTTPLSIASGQSNLSEDASLVRDANGLPMIPGPSLAGVLRALHRRLQPQVDADRRPLTDDIFGCIDRDGGVASRLTVSHGVLLDQHGKAVEGLLVGPSVEERLERDPILKRARTVNAAIQRDRVRIAARGAAAATGLFDRTILPAGYRFGLEVSLGMAADGDEEWHALLSLFAHPLFRLGGGTRAGLGAIKVVTAHHAMLALDLRRGGRIEDLDTLRQLHPTLTDTRGLRPITVIPPADPALLTARLVLRPRHAWRIGGGAPSTSAVNDDKAKNTALLPKRERRLTWAGGGPQFHDDDLLFPASSVKGVLAHRAAFHARCAAGRWADDLESVWQVERADCPEVQWLFGTAADDTLGTGAAGRLLIDDQWLELDRQSGTKAEVQTHNAIDRFTGGVRAHMLFQEQVIRGGEIPLTMTIDLAPRAGGQHGDSAFNADSVLALEALQKALDDLLGGRLAIGAQVSTGQGLMHGSLIWHRPNSETCPVPLDVLEDRA